MNAKLFNASLLTACVLLASASPASASGYAFTDLGRSGNAQGINNAGQVVGSALTSDGKNHATIWNGTTPTDLGTLGGWSSYGVGINDSGQVVGNAQTSDGTYHATIWNGTTPTDLNDYLSISDRNAGWRFETATGINDSGWITGGAHNYNTGFNTAFLLTPCPTCTSYPYVYPVPEPETYALFMAGLGLMGFIARRRKDGQA